MEEDEFIVARKSQLHYYVEVSLYRRAKGKNFVLYKKPGMGLRDIRLDQSMHPQQLFIKRSEKIKGIQEAQKGFNRQLSAQVKSKDHAKIKETLVTVMEETLTEPRSGSLEGFSDTMDVLVSDYSRESDVIKNLIDISYKDYSTILHSINVMAFVLGYASHMGYSRTDSKSLGLSALLHDVGKTQVDPEILTAPRKLTDEEFSEIQSHTTRGYSILRQCKFGDTRIAISALEHHEKEDGSGYPNRKSKISQSAQIIGLIDCYEALTNDDRPYRSSMGVFDALSSIIGKDVRAGEFNKEVYANFIKSLSA